jgi:transcription antitermination factor NusG
LIVTGDVVRVSSGQMFGKTGVVNRISGSRVNVFLKGEYIGIWFNVDELRRIGRTTVK